MEGLSLYKIGEAWIDTLEALEAIEDEEEKAKATEELNNQIAVAVKNKADGIIKYNKNINASKAIIKDEIKRLKEMEAYGDRVEKRMNDSIQNAMELMDLKKIECSVGIVTLAKAPLSVELETELENIPADYIRIKETKELDKTAVKELYKEKGIMLPGIKYNTDNRSLRIK